MQLCALVLVLSLAASTARADTQLNAAECQKLGWVLHQRQQLATTCSSTSTATTPACRFSKETSCSDCTLMEEYVKDAGDDESSCGVFCFAATA
jgi:hypothetical protein